MEQAQGRRYDLWGKKRARRRATTGRVTRPDQRARGRINASITTGISASCWQQRLPRGTTQERALRQRAASPVAPGGLDFHICSSARRGISTLGKRWLCCLVHANEANASTLAHGTHLSSLPCATPRATPGLTTAGPSCASRPPIATTTGHKTRGSFSSAPERGPKAKIVLSVCGSQHSSTPPSAASLRRAQSAGMLLACREVRRNNVKLA